MPNLLSTEPTVHRYHRLARLVATTALIVGGFIWVSRFFPLAPIGPGDQLAPFGRSRLAICIGPIDDVHVNTSDMRRRVFVALNELKSLPRWGVLGYGRNSPIVDPWCPFRPPELIRYTASGTPIAGTLNTIWWLPAGARRVESTAGLGMDTLYINVLSQSDMNDFFFGLRKNSRIQSMEVYCADGCVTVSKAVFVGESDVQNPAVLNDLLADALGVKPAATQGPVLTPGLVVAAPMPPGPTRTPSPTFVPGFTPLAHLATATPTPTRSINP